MALEVEISTESSAHMQSIVAVSRWWLFALMFMPIGVLAQPLRETPLLWAAAVAASWVLIYFTVGRAVMAMGAMSLDDERRHLVKEKMRMIEAINKREEQILEREAALAMADALQREEERARREREASVIEDVLRLKEELDQPEGE